MEPFHAEIMFYHLAETELDPGIDFRLKIWHLIPKDFNSEVIPGVRIVHLFKIRPWAAWKGPKPL
jgi:hypothetical protein